MKQVKLAFATLTDINQVIANPRRNDCICLDLDDMLPASQHEKKALIKNLNWLKEIGIKVLVTTRDSTIASEFNDFNPIKPELLIEHIKKFKEPPKRISIVSSSKELLDHYAGQNNIDGITSKVKLYQYSPPKHQNILKQENKPKNFPDTLENYGDPISLDSQTNNTFKISSKNENDPVLVLKFNANQDAIKLKILCNAIYHLLGVNVPASEAFNTLPPELAKELGIAQHGIYQISEYIDIKPSVDNKINPKIIEAIQSDFVKHVLLGNIGIIRANNVVETTNGEIKVINADSDHLLKLLQNRNEESGIVAEIDAMRSGVDSKEWFGSITDHEIKQQVFELLKLEQTIEQEVWQIAEKLELPDTLRVKFLQFLSDRLDYLALRFCPEIKRYPKTDRKSDDNQTAAGVLTFTMHNQKPDEPQELYVLLSKRCDHFSDNKEALWDCFGGGSETVDDYLHVTAAREVLEESAKELLHPPTALLSSPFHDFVTEKNGKPFIYRMYLREHEYIDPSKFKDHEHSEHKWIKLSDLKNSLQQAPILENGKETAEVISEGKKILLFPEFYQLLKQQTILDNISSPRKKKPFKLPLKATKKTNQKNNAKEPTEKKDTAKEAPLRHFHSPQELTWQAKKTVLDYLQTLIELKQAFAEEKKTKDSDEPHVTKNSESPSELHLHAILRDEYEKDNPLKNIINILGKASNHTSELKKLSDTEKDNLYKQCLRLLTAEKQGSPERIYFYHGCSSQVAFSYEIYSAINQLLQANKQWFSFRATDEYFKTFANIEAFIQHYTSISSDGIIDNNSPQYNETTLSANIALFSNYEISGSFSLGYFLENKTARDIDLKAMLKNILASSGMPETLLNPLLQIYETYYKDYGGTLYQFSMPVDVADSLSYTASIGGPLNPYKGSYKLSEVFRLLKADLDSNNPDDVNLAVNYLEKLQVRVMTPPHQALEVNRVTLHDIKNTQPQHKLEDFSDLIKNLLYEMVLDSNTDLLHPSVPAERIFAEHLKKNQLSREKGISIAFINRAFEAQEHEKIKQYVKESPEIAEHALALSVEKNLENVAGFIVNLYPEFKIAKIKPPTSYIDSLSNNKNDVPISLFDLIFQHSTRKDELLEACFGKEWVKELPHDFKHTNSALYYILKALPENERTSYAEKHLDKSSNLECIGQIISVLPQTDQLKLLESILNNSALKIENINEIYGSIFNAIQNEDDLIKIIEFCLIQDPTRIPTVSVFSTGLKKISSSQQKIAKTYFDINTDIPNVEFSDAFDFRYLIQALHNGDDIKYICQYTLQKTNIFEALKRTAFNWLKENSPDSVEPKQALADAIKWGNCEIVLKLKNENPDIFKNKLPLDYLNYDSKDISIFTAIVLGEKNKESLLKIIFGDDWQSHIKNDDIIDCADASNTIQDFNALFKLLSDEQCKLLCNLQQDKLKLLFKEKDYYRLFESISPEKFKIIVSAFKEFFLLEISNLRQYEDLVSNISLEQQNALYEIWQTTYPKIFQSLKNVLTIFNDNNKRKHVMLYETRKNELLNLINTIDDLFTLANYISPAYYDLSLKILNPYNDAGFNQWIENSHNKILIALDNDKNTWKLYQAKNDKSGFYETEIPDEVNVNELIQDPNSEYNILRTIIDKRIIDYTLPYYCDVIESCKHKLLNFIKSSHDFNHLRSAAPPIFQEEFFKQCINKILDIIKQDQIAVSSIQKSFNLTADEFILIIDYIKNQPTEFIKSHTMLESFLKTLSEEEQTQFLIQNKAFVSEIIKEHSFYLYFPALIKNLTKAHKIIVITEWSDVLTTSIKDGWQFNSFLMGFLKEERAQICKSQSALLENIVKNNTYSGANQINYLIRDLSLEECQEVFQTWKNIVFLLVSQKNARELTQLFDGLDPEKHRAIYIECKNFYIEAIRSDPNQFLIIAKILAHDELKEVYLSCKNEILSLLKKPYFYEFREFMKFFEEKEFKEILNYCKEQKINICRPSDFNSLCKDIKQDQRDFLYEQSIESLVKNTYSLSTLGDILPHLTPEKISDFCQRCMNSINSYLVFSDFNELLDKLNPEQCQALCVVFQGKIISRIQTIDEFYSNFEKLDTEKHHILYETCKNHLWKLIDKKSDFTLITTRLTPNQRTELVELIENYVNIFENKLHKIYPNNPKSRMISFFQTNLATKLKDGKNILDKFVLIKQELKDPLSQATKIMKSIEMDSVPESFTALSMSR